MLAAPTPPSDAAPPPTAETLDVGGWQVVVTDGHAVLPEGMTHLPDRAFRGRTSLVSVAFPRSLVSIGDVSFLRCSSLVTINLPAGLTSIGWAAFGCCSALTSVAFPAGLASISCFAFYGCSLAHVALPVSLSSIGEGAFHSCTSLARVSFPAGLTAVGRGAFDGCTRLARVIVPITARTNGIAFPTTTTILCRRPAEMRWYEAVGGALAYKRCRPGLLGWLQRAQISLGAYGPDGAARKRDREEFEGDFGPLTQPAGA